MADAGYGTAQNYIYAQDRQADVIVRITPKNFCLYNEDNEKISLVSLLKQAQERGNGTVDIFGFCKYKNRTGFVRVIAQKLPPEQAEKSQKRRKRKASKNQRKNISLSPHRSVWNTAVRKFCIYTGAAGR